MHWEWGTNPLAPLPLLHPASASWTHRTYCVYSRYSRLLRKKCVIARLAPHYSPQCLSSPLRPFAWKIGRRRRRLRLAFFSKEKEKKMKISPFSFAAEKKTQWGEGGSGTQSRIDSAEEVPNPRGPSIYLADRQDKVFPDRVSIESNPEQKQTNPSSSVGGRRGRRGKKAMLLL